MAQRIKVLCDHKCHDVGLNPWVEFCPICGCFNPSFNEKAKAPTTFAELLGGVGAEVKPVK